MKIFKRKNIIESGSKHWLLQKISAILMLPLSIWLLIELPDFLSMGYEKKAIWLNNKYNFFFIIFFFLISSYHMKLGLTVVIEDYIHNQIIKKILLKTLKIFTLIIIVLNLILMFIFWKKI